MVCHGLRGEGDGELTPRLAGLPVGYIVKQMQDYADGRRADPQMEPIAQALDPRERLAVAAYYADLPSPMAAQAGERQGQPVGAALYHRGDAPRGIPACGSCHGARGEGGPPANPPLAGQPAGYLHEQIKRWRASKRRNDPQNAMLEISLALTQAEAEAVSTYSAAPPSTPAEPVAVPPAAPAASP